MFAIKVGGWSIDNKERRSISVWTSICHRQDSFMGVWNPNTFISKLWPVCAQRHIFIVGYNFSTLHHESRYYSWEISCFIMHIHSMFSGAECSEVLNRFRKHLLEEFHYYFPFCIITICWVSNLDIHVNLHVIHVESRHVSIWPFLLKKHIDRISFYFILRLLSSSNSFL